MRLQAVPVLMVTLAFCSAGKRWDTGSTTPDPAGINAAMNLFSQYANNKQGTNPPYRPATTPRFQVTTPGSTPDPTAGGTCYAENQAAGKCVKSSMCDMTPNKFDSTLLIGYRSHKKPSMACAFLKVCCPTDKIIPEPVAPASSTAPGCGYSNTAAGMFRERMGTSDSGYADFAEFPWMVALLNNTKLGQTQPNAETNPRYIGGGTLIHPSVVLTVAHKVGSLDPSDLICRAGEWDTENENELYPHQDREVRDIILHNQFDILRSHNNIALVMLVTPFVIQPNINVACLSPTMPAPRTLCYSMGWGMDFTRGKYYASVLKKIPLPLVGSNECERKLRNTRLGRKFHLHRSLTCSGGVPNFDTCIGDGGSPLVCPVENSAFPRYTVVGLVAYGIGCGEAGVPGAYAKVPELYNWISNQMAMENISDRPYVLN